MTKLDLFKKTKKINKVYNVYISSSTLLEARSLGCMLKAAQDYKRKNTFKKIIYEYIMIFMQGQVFQSSLFTFIILSALTVFTVLIRFVNVCRQQKNWGWMHKDAYMHRLEFSRSNCWVNQNVKMRHHFSLCIFFFKPSQQSINQKEII